MNPDRSGEPPVVVADPSVLVAAALTESLLRAGVPTAEPVTDEAALRHRCSSGHGDVVVGDGPLVLLSSSLVPAGRLGPLVRELVDRGTPCLVLLAGDGVEPLPLLEAGALGFVPADAGEETLLRSVDAARRGEACVPRSTLSDILRALIERRRADDEAQRCYSGLSRREREVLMLLASGATTGAIADELTLSRATVRSHLSNLMAKLGVRSQVDAVRFVHEHGLAERVRSA